jgi:hypothetical protein
MILTRKDQQYPNRNLSQCHLPTKHSSRPGLPLNWGLRGERQQVCGLSHGTALAECKPSGMLRSRDILNIPEDLHHHHHHHHHQRRSETKKSRSFCPLLFLTVLYFLFCFSFILHFQLFYFPLFSTCSVLSIFPPSLSPVSPILVSTHGHIRFRPRPAGPRFITRK